MSKLANESEEKINAIGIVDNIFNKAIEEGASDIHIEPLKNGMIIRYRIDGLLKEVFEGDKNLYSFIMARVKILAQLDTTGMPHPQEGNIKIKHQENDVDLRISVFPTSLGEATVIRILESDRFFGDYYELGFTKEQVEVLDGIIKKPNGLVLVTGPTGSGKSTTLLTILNKLNTPERSLVTLEDPVERKIEKIRQTAIDPEIGLSFASGLKYLLRQDPDIIMVGEIRDRETAKIAVRAAVTGHLVLSTIHTNNAAGAIVRLINMGIEPFLLASSLKFISAQRLARMNCPTCKNEYIPSDKLKNILKAPKNTKFYHSVGCDECSQRGVRGRKGMHEILAISKGIQELILTRPSGAQINDLAIEEGMLNLRQAALQKVYDGTISIEEALRLTE